MLHEKEFQKQEKNVSRATENKTSPPVSDSPQLLLLDEHTEPEILDLTGMEPEQIRYARVERRKHFPPSTKMQILHQQECRDPIFDFVLKEASTKFIFVESFYSLFTFK